MKKLSKKQSEALEELRSRLENSKESADALVISLRHEVAAYYEKLQEAVSNYNHDVSEYNSLIDEIHGEAQSYMDEHSEQWQDSDKGQSYQCWIDEIDQARAQELEMIEVDVPDFDADVPDTFNEEPQ